MNMKNIDAGKKLHRASMVAFIYFASTLLVIIILTGQFVAEFAEKRQALGADFWLSADFTSGLSHIIVGICCVVTFIVLSVMLLQIHDAKTPFLPRIPRLMKTVAVILLIGWGGCLLGAIVLPLIIFGWPLTKDIILAGYTEWPLALGLIFLCLSYAFEHGLKLQQENDELL
jgi:hypothetical protein